MQGNILRAQWGAMVLVVDAMIECAGGHQRVFYVVKSLVVREVRDHVNVNVIEHPPKGSVITK